MFADVIGYSLKEYQQLFDPVRSVTESLKKIHNLLTQIQLSQALLIMQQNFIHIFPPLIVKETKAKPISFAYCGLCLLTINTRSNKQSTVSNFIKNSDGSTMQTPHWKSSDGSLRRCLTLEFF